MMTVCACLWLGLFPLLQFGTYSSITHDKWVIMLVLACLSLLFLFFSAATEDPKPQKSRKAGKAKPQLKPYSSLPFKIALMLAGWILLACLFSPYSIRVWGIGASSRREGLLSQLCYLCLFFIFVFARVRRIPVMLSSAAGAAVFFGVVLLQRSGVNVFGLYPKGREFANAGEFQGTIGNIDIDTGYLCLMAGLFLTEITQVLEPEIRKILMKRRSRLGSGQIPDHGVGLSKSPAKSSRSGRSSRHSERSEESPLPPTLYLLILSAALAMAVYLIITMGVQLGIVTLLALCLITMIRYIPRKWRIPVLVVLLVLALAVVWFWPWEGGGVWELKEILHGRPQLSFGSNRLGVWFYSLRLALRQLPAGSGSDTFVISFNNFLANEGLELPHYQGDVQMQTDFDNPHNEYIAHLINHGLPAMLLFIALIVTAVFFCRKKNAKEKAAAPSEDRLRALSPWAVAVLCYAVQAFFSFSISMLAPMFWVVLGICVRNGVSAERSA